MAGNTTLDPDPDLEQRPRSDLDANERRTLRARNERMVVVPDADADGECIGFYAVVTAGDEYTVDLGGDEARCTCPDHEYRRSRCKHIRRVCIEINERDLPAPGHHIQDDAAAVDRVVTTLRREQADLASQIEMLSQFLDRIENSAAVE